MNLSGKTFNGLMHVSDWFPTILDLANITNFKPRIGYELDGISQFQSWKSDILPIRKDMLYNSAYQVAKKNFHYMTNGSFAVRNEKYKLIHFYDSPNYGDWYDYNTVSNDDDSPNVAECATTTYDYFNGKFVYALYDLINDPYETTNLYDSNILEIQAIKSELYEMLQKYHMKSKPDMVKLLVESSIALEVWNNASGYIVPYVLPTVIDTYSGSEDSFQSKYPLYCPIS